MIRRTVPIGPGYFLPPTLSPKWEREFIWLLVVLLSLGSGACRPSADFDALAPVGRRAPTRIEPFVLPATLPVVAPATVPTTAPASLEVSIEQCRQWCLENNLSLRVQRLNPAIARQAISEERSRFESVFFTDAAVVSQDTPVFAPGSDGGVQSHTTEVGPGVRIPLTTGGDINLSLPMSRSSSDPAGFPDPAYGTDFAASISHPLLRNAGEAVNMAPLRIAQYQYRISQAQTKLEVIRVLATVDRVYWRLYAARQELLVRKQQYDLANAQLEQARRLARAGTVPEVEIVRAESGAADRLEAIITADTAVRDRQRELKRILNQPGLEMESAAALVPATEPRPRRYRFDVQTLADAAVRNRAEMLELELRIAQESLNIIVARNGLLPLLSLAYTYRLNGLGPLPADAFDLMIDNRFADHRLGLRLEVPLGNEAARSRLRRALLSRQQQLASRDAQGQQIRQEVLGAVDQLQATWQRILASRNRVVLASRVLEAEQRQFEQGLRTSTDVLDAQTRLADAQSAEIQALAEYHIALVDLAFASGTTLGAADVDWE